MSKNTIKLPHHGATDDAAMEKVIAAQAKINELQREVKALRRDRNDLLSEHTDLRNARSVPSAPAKPRKGPTADRVRVAAGDIHGMRMDRAAVGAFLRDVAALDPDEVVIGGDLVECGGWLAKHQPIGYVAYCDYSYQEDIAAAAWFLDELQKAAPRAQVHYIEGNHEDRVERWIVDQVMAAKRDAQFLHDAFSPSALLRLHDRGISYYRRSEIYVDGLPRGWIKLGEMYFTHSLTYSRNAARDAAQKTAGSVTYWCTHRRDAATIVFPTVGLVEAFNPGCLSQMQPIWKHSDPTTWSQGYAVDFIAASGASLRVQVPIWKGDSMATSMTERFARARA